MKIGDNLYRCHCGEIIEYEVHRREGAGQKGVAVSMIKCKCGCYVSQKTKIELDSKPKNVRRR